MRGGPRRNKPTAIKMLTGNPGKRALPKREPRPASGVPAPPEHLTADERELWDYYAPLLAASKVLTVQDREALVQFCEARAQVVEIKRQQADPAYRRVLVSVVVDGAGNEKPKVETNPLDAQRRQWTQNARLCGAELGLSPMSRARVATVGGEEREADPLEGLLRAVK